MTMFSIDKQQDDIDRMFRRRSEDSIPTTPIAGPSVVKKKVVKQLQRVEGTFTIQLPAYVTRRPSQDVPFKTSNLIPQMSTSLWDLKMKGGKWNVNFIIYPHLRKGSFTKGWLEFVKDNGLKGDDVLEFEVKKTRTSKI